MSDRYLETFYDKASGGVILISRSKPDSAVPKDGKDRVVDLSKVEKAKNQN